MVAERARRCGSYDLTFSKDQHFYARRGRAGYRVKSGAGGGHAARRKRQMQEREQLRRCFRGAIDHARGGRLHNTTTTTTTITTTASNNNTTTTTTAQRSTKISHAPLRPSVPASHHYPAQIESWRVVHRAERARVAVLPAHHDTVHS